MKNIDEFLAIVNLCNDTELETLTNRCEQLLNERRTAARNTVRQELMENLQKAMDDILYNGFNLMIENVENPNWIVQFVPGEKIYHIEIE